MCGSRSRTLSRLSVPFLPYPNLGGTQSRMALVRAWAQLWGDQGSFQDMPGRPGRADTCAPCLRAAAACSQSLP